MKDSKFYKYSNIALYVCPALAALAFIVGSLIGFSDIVGDCLIDLMLLLIYVLTFAAISLLAVSSFKSIRLWLKTLSSKGEDGNRIPTGKIKVWVIAILLVSIILGLVEGLITQSDKTSPTEFRDSLLADTFIASIVILTMVAITCILSGITKRNKK